MQNSPEMQIVLIRTFCFIFFISGLWALLPVIVSHDPRLGASGYGLLLDCIGVGANETAPSAGSLRVIRLMKSAMSRRFWPNRVWTIYASSIA